MHALAHYFLSICMLCTLMLLKILRSSCFIPPFCTVITFTFSEIPAFHRLALANTKEMWGKKNPSALRVDEAVIHNKFLYSSYFVSKMLVKYS